MSVESIDSRLKAYNAVLFGSEHSRPQWESLIYINCDRDSDICKRAGITQTPTLVFGGVKHTGSLSVDEITDRLNAADAALNTLQKADATLLVIDSCGWCKRQVAALGSNAEQKVHIVNCSAKQTDAMCAGVSAFPSWKFNPNGPAVPGFRPLPVLASMAAAAITENHQ